MDPKIEEAIKFVHAYAPEINEWKVLKKELLKTLPSVYRKQFSKVDKKTRILLINDFETTIIDFWKKITNSELYLVKNEIKKTK